MSLLTSLDRSVMNRTGLYTTTENGCVAYKNESNDLEQQLVTLFFQLTLQEKDNKYIHTYFEKILNNVYSTKNNKKYMKYICALILQTRDIEEGKGLNMLSYVMLEVLSRYCMKYENSLLTFHKVFEKFLIMKDKNTGKDLIPCGSYKDFKLLCGVIQKYSPENNKKKYILISEITRIHIIPVLVEDIKKYNMTREEELKNVSLSLICKWLPREKSKYKYIANIVAHELAYEMNYSNLHPSIICANYRKTIAKHNKHLDTTQILMCSNNWKNIDFKNVTSLTIHKCKSAFLNKNDIQCEDRYKCKEHFLDFKDSKEGKGIVSKNLMIHQLIRGIRNINNDDDMIDIYEKQYSDMVTKITDNFKFIIPVIDVSPSMTCDNSIPLFSAIGLGMLIMEKNGGRGFTFDEIPNWIIMNNEETFKNKVYEIINSRWGGTTNLEKVFEMFLDTAMSNSITEDEMSKYSILVLSDMQFNQCQNKSHQTIMENIKFQYKECGYNIMPHLIWWNLRTSDSTPAMKDTPSTTMVSGNNHTLFKIFMDGNLEKLKTQTPWESLVDILNNERYINIL